MKRSIFNIRSPFANGATLKPNDERLRITVSRIHALSFFISFDQKQLDSGIQERLIIIYFVDVGNSCQHLRLFSLLPTVGMSEMYTSPQIENKIHSVLTHKIFFIQVYMTKHIIRFEKNTFSKSTAHIFQEVFETVARMAARWRLPALASRRST